MTWFDGTPHLHACFCRSTQHGLLRLLTTAAVTGAYKQAPLSNREAWSKFSVIEDDDRIGFADEPGDVITSWKMLSDTRTASPKLWMDAYLAAFAMAGGYRLVTTDKAFKQFKGLDLLLLA